MSDRVQAKDVARYILDSTGVIAPKRLHALLFYCQAYFLWSEGYLLFPEGIRLTADGLAVEGCGEDGDVRKLSTRVKGRVDSVLWVMSHLDTDTMDRCVVRTLCVKVGQLLEPESIMGFFDVGTTA